MGSNPSRLEYLLVRTYICALMLPVILAKITGLNKLPITQLTFWPVLT